jgi:hypothetical protein
MNIEFFADGSPDCPLILIYGREPEQAAILMQSVHRLAEGETNWIAVHELLGFNSVDGCKLFARVSSNDGGVQRLPEREAFECLLRPASWSNIEGLLEPFTDPNTPSGRFQWLDEHGDVDLLISTHRGW